MDEAQPFQPDWANLVPVGATRPVKITGPVGTITGTTGETAHIADAAPPQPNWNELQPAAKMGTNIFSPAVEAVRGMAASFKRDIIGGLGEVTAFLAENWGVKDPNWKPAEWLPESYKNFLLSDYQKTTEQRKALAEKGRVWAAQWDQAAQSGMLPVGDMGKRIDGTDKGLGFFGAMKRPDGGISTELSIGVQIKGKEIQIPTLIPTLSKQEIDSLLSGEDPSPTIVQKAVDFANQRIAQGKSPFAQQGEQDYSKNLWAPTEGLTFGKNPITKTFQVVGYALPMYAAAVASSLVTKSPAPGMALFGIQQGADTYETARKEGFAPEQAKLYALADGAWTAGSELLPFETLLGSGGKQIIKSMAKNAMVEGTQEVMQQVGSNIIAKYGYDKGRPLFEGWLENFVGGAFLGAGGGAVASKVAEPRVQETAPAIQINDNLTELRSQVDKANIPVQLIPEQQVEFGMKGSETNNGKVQTQEAQKVDTSIPQPSQEQQVSSPIPAVPETPALSVDKTARITKIDSDIKAIDTQLDEMDRLIAERTSAGKSVVQVENRQRTLYTQREALTAEKLNIQTNPEMELGRQHGEVRADQLRSMQAATARAKITALAQGVREGKALAKNEARDVQHQVISLIEHSSIPKEKQASFMRTVKNIQTSKHLVNKAPDILWRLRQMEEDFKIRSLRNDIAAKLKSSAPKRQNSILRSKLSVEAQRTLSQIREYTKMKEAQITEKLKDPSFDSALLNLAGNIKNKSSEELQALHGVVSDLISTGRSKVLEKQQVRKAFREEVQQEAKYSIIANNPSKGERIKGAREAFRNAISGLGKSLTAWDGLMDALSSYDPKHELTKMMDMNKSLEAWKLNVEQQHSAAYDDIQKAAGFTKIKQLWHHMTEGTRVKNLGNHVVQEIKEVKGQEPTVTYRTQKLELTDNEAIYLYAKMQEPSMRESLKRSNGFTFKEDVGLGEISTEELIGASLTREQKAIGDAFLDFLAKYRERVNPFYADRFGVDMPMIERYSPQMREGDLPDTNIDPLAPTSVVNHMVNPSAFKSRTYSTKRILIQDVFKVLTQHITSIEHFMSMADQMDKVNAVFKNGEIRKAIQDTYGPGLLKVVDAKIKDFETGHPPPVEAWLRWIERIRINLVRAKIAGKTTISIKQIFQTLGYAMDVPTVDFIKNFPKTPTQIKEAIRVIGQTETYKARGTSMERDIHIALSSSKFKAVKGMNSWLDAMTAYALLGDKVSVVLGGYSVYKTVLDKTGSQEKALDAFSKSTNSTQQSANLDQQTAFASNTGIFGRISSTFMTGQNQIMQRVMRAAKDVYFNPNAENYKQLAKTILIGHILMPTLYQFATNGFEWDNEDQARAAILGSLNGMFLIGDAIDAVMAVMMNKFAGTNMKLFRSGNLLTDASNELIKSIQNINPDEVTFEDFIKLTAAIMEPWKGLPITTGAHMAGAVGAITEGNTQQGIMKLLGWSPYIVDKNSVSSKNKRRE